MWKAFNIDDLKAGVSGPEPQFLVFLRSAQMSCAVYRNPAGSRDMLAPRLEDELNVVLEGKARVQVGDHEREVGPGAVLFVRATTEHSFFDVTDDLTLLAIFGPGTA